MYILKFRTEFPNAGFQISVVYKLFRSMINDHDNQNQNREHVPHFRTFNFSPTKTRKELPLPTEIETTSFMQYF
jgi:hypothetical protein